LAYFSQFFGLDYGLFYFWLTIVEGYANMKGRAKNTIEICFSGSRPDFISEENQFEFSCLQSRQAWDLFLGSTWLRLGFSKK